MNEIRTAGDVYSAAASGDKRARLSLILRGILSSACEKYFDSTAGTVKPIEITAFIKGISSLSREVIHDRIYSIAANASSSVKSIISLMRERIAREHAMLPVKDVREVDDATVRWLSRKTGRNLREKLAGKPYMFALRRYMTIDTAENRLFKEMAGRLCRLIEIRENTLGKFAGDECAALMKIIRVWLRSDEAAEIGAWKNIPPNNTLLHDKRYRKIWEAWNEIETLDEKVISDYQNAPENLAEILKWKLIYALTSAGNFRTPQQLVCVSFDSFTASTNYPIILGRNDGKILTAENISHGFMMSTGGTSFSISANGEELKFMAGEKSAKIPADESSLDAAILARKLFGIDSLSQKNETDKILTPEYIAADISRPYPRYYDGAEFGTLRFRLALQFWDDNAAMCDNASAMFFGDNVTTATISAIISEGRIRDSQKYEAAEKLIARLHESVRPSKEFAYIVPDYADDFSLAPLRRAVNMSYANAVPVPSSIAAVISFQKSENFSSCINPDSVMLVIDSAENCITLTPVKASMNDSDELKALIPESFGVTWERHPPVVIPLKRADSHPEFGDISGAFGLRGLSDENGKMSAVSLPGLEWHNAENIIPNPVDVLKSEEIISALESLRNEHKDSNFTVIIASDDIAAKYDDMPFACKIFMADKLSGAFTLRQWQTLAGEKELWRDHLPDLVMSSGGAKLQLVHNASIVPRRNKTQHIKVGYTFELQAGKNSYMFRLQKGEGREKLKYAASLKSSAFPLSRNVECSMDLTYTYGADAPYELTFRPVRNDAPFKAVRTEWIPAGKIEPFDPKEAGLSAPQYPQSKSWLELENFPKKDSNATHSLLEWFTHSFSQLEEVLCYDPQEKARAKAESWRRRVQEGRIRGTVTYIGKDKNGGKFFKVDTDEGRAVVFHSGIADTSEEERITECISVWLKIDYSRPTTSRGEYVGVNMSIDENISVPDSLMRKYIDDAEKFRPVISGSTAKRIKSARFPAYNIWKNGHSLSEYDAPEKFREKVHRITAVCEKALDSPEIPADVKDEIFYVLCCMGRDTPAFIAKRLTESCNNLKDIGAYKMHIAYAISDASSDWQKHLFSLAVNPSDDIRRVIRLQILAVALWRSEKIIFSMTYDEWKYIAVFLHDELTEQFAKLTRKNSGRNKTWDLSRMLELLLAMLRSRDDQRREVRMILAPHSELAESFSELIDNISDSIVKSGLELESCWVEIEISGGKPEAFREWPDLLYALHVYFDSEGDSDVGSVKIKGFMESE